LVTDLIPRSVESECGDGCAAEAVGIEAALLDQLCLVQVEVAADIRSVEDLGRGFELKQDGVGDQAGFMS